MTGDLFGPTLEPGTPAGHIRYPAIRRRFLFDDGLVVDVVTTDRDDSTVRALILQANPGHGGITAGVMLEVVGWYDFTPHPDYDHGDHSPDRT